MFKYIECVHYNTLCKNVLLNWNTYLYIPKISSDDLNFLCKKKVTIHIYGLFYKQNDINKLHP